MLAEWQRLELPSRDECLVVAVSGGPDSTALLLALSQLITLQKLVVKLSVAHIDHGLRGRASRDDASWVKELAGRLGHESVFTRLNIKLRARKHIDNVEQAARLARYEFLAKAARNEGAQLVLTGHTMDDQAETVLLNLLRGSGVEGLAGIAPVRVLDNRNGTLLVRPLLNWARHADTEKYCAERGITPRSDEMNLDEQYSRVRVRRQLLPLMGTFNGRVVEALARTARLLREDSSALSDAAAHLLEQARNSAAQKQTDGDKLLTRHAKNKSAALCVEVLASASPALRRRALRRWIAEGRGDLRRLELVHILAVEKLLCGTRGGRVIELPGGGRVIRKRGALEFLPAPQAGRRAKNRGASGIKAAKGH
ncbi:MAG: tRNA(Ile)-lysidine synthase [Blastocatellia bacterium]|nr:tRNA(Ile)-lysidine synthase [Blastocatellia bacterium]